MSLRMAQIIIIRNYYCYYAVKFVPVRQYQGISELIANVLAWSHGSELPVPRISTSIVVVVVNHYF